MLSSRISLLNFPELRLTLIIIPPRHFTSTDWPGYIIVYVFNGTQVMNVFGVNRLTPYTHQTKNYLKIWMFSHFPIAPNYNNLHTWPNVTYMATLSIMTGSADGSSQCRRDNWSTEREREREREVTGLVNFLCPLTRPGSRWLLLSQVTSPSK